MEGIVFTEFFEMVEEAHGYNMVDQLILDNNLPSGGAYTTIGTYSQQEMVRLVVDLSKKTQTPVSVLLNNFGKYLFGTFKKGYPMFFDMSTNAFEFLESIEKYIHIEVKKLYPDAQLPKFSTKRIGVDTLEMIYYSDRNMADFAMGLIEKTFEHYEEKATISRVDLVENGNKVMFLIKKVDSLVDSIA